MHFNFFPLPQRSADSQGHSHGTAAAAALESQVAVLQQQVTQLTSELRRTKRALENRDSELQRCEASLTASRETISAKDAALASAKRSLAEREAALHERDVQFTALEARHTEALALSAQQVAIVRASRDEELERMKTEAETGKCSMTTDYETQLSRARVAEAELRSGTQRLREENEALRSANKRAESRAAEAELSAQRAMSKFESALATLRQLEEQYEALAKDAEHADALRAERILSLENEVESLRVSKAALAQERDEAVTAASKHAQQALAEARDAVSQHQRAEIAAEDATAAATRLRQQLEEITARCSSAESEVRKWREEAGAARGELERQNGAYSGSQALLEATNLALDASRREAEGLREECDRHKTAATQAEERATAAIAGMETSREQYKLAKKEAEELAEELREQQRAAAAAVQLAEVAAEIKLKNLENSVASLETQLSSVLKEQEELHKALEEAKTNARVASPKVVQHDEKLSAPPATPGVSQGMSVSAPSSMQPSPTADVFDQLHANQAENDPSYVGLTPQSAPPPEQTTTASIAGGPGHSSSPLNAKNYREEELAAENAKLRQQLATFKLSLLSPTGTYALGGGVTTSAGGGSRGGRGGDSVGSPASISGIRLPPLGVTSPSLLSGGAYSTSSGVFGGANRNYVASGGTSLVATERVLGSAAAGRLTNSGTARGGGSADDALAKARRQVMLAKEYLHQVAKVGPGGSGGSTSQDNPK